MTDAVKLPPMPDPVRTALGPMKLYAEFQVRAYAIQAVMDERALQVSTAREVQPEKGESLGNSIAPAAGNLVIAMEEAIASIEAGMHQGAADTLRAALWTIRAQPEVS